MKTGKRRLDWRFFTSYETIQAVSTGGVIKKRRYYSFPANQYSEAMSRFTTKIIILSAWFVSLLLIQSCATTSVFMPYPFQIGPLLSEIDRLGSLTIKAPHTHSGPNEVLYYLEQGRLAQINQQPDYSKQYFDLAIQYFAATSREAQIQASKLSQQGSSLLLNDNIISYPPPAHEQLYVHHFQALNYLFERNLEAAGVEVRRANTVHVHALKNYEQEVEEARHKAKDLPINLDDIQDQMLSIYNEADKAANSLKNSFQNGYAFYASGLIYELRGEWDDAFIDYKKALDINPNNPYILRDVHRLAKQLGHSELYETLTTQLGELPAIKHNQGEVVIFYEDQFVPAKQDITIPLIDYRDRAIAISFPIYNHLYTLNHPLNLYLGSVPEDTNKVAASATVSDTYALVTKALQEQRFGLIVRQAGRAIAKTKLTHKSEEAAGGIGAVLASFYNLVSEQADLRSWLSLPERVDIIRTALPVGAQILTVKPDASSLSKSLPLVIQPNSLTVIQVTNTGSRLFVRSSIFQS